MQVILKKISIDNPKVPQEIAMEEFQGWLDYKKTKMTLVMEGAEVTEEKIGDIDEDNKAAMAIVEAIMSGDLVVNEDMSLTYNLAFPIRDENQSVVLNKLTLKPRMNAFEVQKATKGISQDEPFKLFIGYVHVLSGEVKGLVNKLDSIDFSLLQKIVGYFL